MSFKCKQTVRHCGLGLLLTAPLYAVSVPSAPNPDVVRFLEQATWGPTDALIQQVQTEGLVTYLDTQFNTPPTDYTKRAPAPTDSKVLCPPGSPPTCYRDNYTQYPNQVEFFLHGIHAPDQLRQRVAFGLHQILVVSGLKIRQPSSMAPYLNLLLDDAFTNYRQILHDITLNPAMGHYLDMINNDRPSADGKIKPNENYAREILQLFSIGLNWLNPDGTVMLDENGQPIPTYDQDTVEGFAHAFTGWTYAGGASNKFPNNPVNFIDPMVLVEPHHDKNAKQLLGLTPKGSPVKLPANQTGTDDLTDAINNIFVHPNVGPFVGKQLIQHLVTSNPSPAYVKRVTGAFDSGDFKLAEPVQLSGSRSISQFGSGQRGDMTAVIAAILLDGEARGALKTDGDYGLLREPAQLVLNVCRAFNAKSDGILNGQTKAMGQDLFYPPTVFNYYPHEFSVPGTTLQGPQFGIDSSSEALSRLNFINTIVFSSVKSPASDSGTQLDLSGPTALAADPTLLVDDLDQRLLHGAMTPSVRAAILGAVNGVPAANPLLRARTALYLVLASGQYQVER